jgi:hypothetical protein
MSTPKNTTGTHTNNNEVNQEANSAAIVITTLMRELTPTAYNMIYNFIFHPDFSYFQNALWEMFSHTLIKADNIFDGTKRDQFAYSYHYCERLMSVLFNTFYAPMNKLGFQPDAPFVELQEEQDAEALQIITLISQKAPEVYEKLLSLITFDLPEGYIDPLLEMYFAIMCDDDLSESQSKREEYTFTCKFLREIILYLIRYFEKAMDKIGSK